VKHHRTIIVLAILALFAILAAAAWYPPARLFALAVRGHSPVCPLSHAVRATANIEETGRIKDRILTASRLVREESGLELWDTPKGQFWIPRGNRFVLPFNLAEMERRVYASPGHFIRPGDIVLDCGASDGDFTREALRAGAARVISIEISPAAQECIRRNLASEISAGRVTLYAKGVWDRDDTLTLNVDDTNFAANSVVLHPESSHPSIQVPLTTIDRIVSELNLPRVDFIKMDVEGAEVKALSGASGVLQRFKPRLAIAAEHKPDDQFTIPAAVRRLRSDYAMECGQCLEKDGRIRPDVLFFF
jgi:FkbM family methyltransferase